MNFIQYIQVLEGSIEVKKMQAKCLFVEHLFDQALINGTLHIKDIF